MSEELSEKKWYIITTIPGQEDKIAVNVQQRVVTAGVQDLVFRVIVPVEKIRVKDKNGQPAFKKNKETG